MTDSTDNAKSFHAFAVLMALCAASHISAHLSQIEFSMHWIAGTAVFLGAMWVVFQPTIPAFLGLAVLQIIDVVVEAPFNPDHWLLIFFVNIVALAAAFRIRRRGEAFTPERLMASLVPAARLVFLVCYGFAALSKYNTDFLFNENSVARELLGHQVSLMPMLSWLVWPPAVPWVALTCETAVVLLLLIPRTRTWGIVVGLLFHAALMVSPAVAVYDFTIAVYTMLYLFTPSRFDHNVRTWFNETRQRMQPDDSPYLSDAAQRPTTNRRWLLTLVPAVALIAVSTHSSMGELSTRLTWLRWMAAMTVVIGIGGLGAIGLFSANRGMATVRWLPRWGLPYAVLLLAIANGLCPYLGLKTQGSFTMFSNLRTEAGEWNHLLIPESVRIIDHYQDRLVRIVDTTDPVLDRNYVQRGLLATEFEVRRRATADPSLSLTIRRDQQDVVIAAAEQDPIFGDPLDLVSRKLLIFRPVSPDGSPFTTN